MKKIKIEEKKITLKDYPKLFLGVLLVLIGIIGLVLPVLQGILMITGGLMIINSVYKIEIVDGWICRLKRLIKR